MREIKDMYRLNNYELYLLKENIELKKDLKLIGRGIIKTNKENYPSKVLRENGTILAEFNDFDTDFFDNNSDKLVKIYIEIIDVRTK